MYNRQLVNNLFFMNIGIYPLSSRVLLAPMAGVTDKPFRQLCRSFGAALASSEMISADKSLWLTKKTLLRAEHSGEEAPISVQIAGSDPLQMAEAACINVQNGAQIIDINMGCPAKKICRTLAGSALLKDEALVFAILKAVVDAVDVPVTLKTRIGWDDEHKNIESIASLAQEAGVAALAIHGRTRTQMYHGQAEYTLITKIKKQVHIPVIANGDIVDGSKALAVLNETLADAVMVGRAAQGQPWIFRDIVSYLENGTLPQPLSVTEIVQIILTHLQAIYQFYGEYSGCRIARKHVAWYTKALKAGNTFRQQMYQLESTNKQFSFVAQFLKLQEMQLKNWP